MGSIIPHYLFVVCYSLDEVLQVHEMAKEIFNPKDQSEKLVSQLNLTSFSSFVMAGIQDGEIKKSI